jgi:heat shock protein HtpX
MGGFGFAVFAVVTLVLALPVGIAGAMVIGLAAAIAWTVVAWFRCESTVLDLSDADVVDQTDEPRLFNVTAGLCAAMGVAPPAIHVLDEPAANALVVGRDVRHASFVVTRGLLDKLTVVELEAVIALLLFKIRSGDTGPESVAVSTVGALGVLSVRAERIDWLSRALAWPDRGVERVLAWLHSSRAEIDTDIAAAGATRYPPGLASALEKMDGHSAVTAASPVTEHLWIAPALALSSRRNAVRIHAPLSERIAVLQEL